MTPYEHCPRAIADPDLPHHGVTGLHSWLLEAVDKARRPWWRTLVTASVDDALAAKAHRDDVLAKALQGKVGA